MGRTTIPTLDTMHQYSSVYSDNVNSTTRSCETEVLNLTAHCNELEMASALNFNTRLKDS